MFDTRSEAWAAVGLEVKVNQQELRIARWRLVVELPLMIGVIEAHSRVKGGHQWFESRNVIDAVAVIVVLILGWLISQDLSKVAPALFRRLDPATAGTVGFLIRLGTFAFTVLGALAVGGINAQTLALGGALTAVVLGLAAQQTLGNLFAGMVLLSARPFRLGERVRLQAGVLAGQIEGVVSGLGLLYTTLSRGDDQIMIPNTVVLTAAILPIREPEAVDVRVTLGMGIRPSQVQEMLDANVAVPTRKAPSVQLEEIKGDSIIVRVQASPERHKDGARLADEILAALVSVTAEHRVKTETATEL
ncbi:MAG: mechanosensitive ion channel domain-containing protein [Solirubrobacteraceae bacterium]